MRTIKNGFCCLITAGMIFSLSACGAASDSRYSDSAASDGSAADVTGVTEVLTETPAEPIVTETPTEAAVTEAPTEAATTSELPSETTFEITKDELMELAWRNEMTEEEEGIANIENIYPGFEIDCEIKDGEYYRVFRSEEKGIEVLEKLYGVEEGVPTSGREITIRNNSGVIREYSVCGGIGNTNNMAGFTRDEKKLFFQDLTNDGQEELVMNLHVAGMDMWQNFVYIFDAQTLEQIELPKRLWEKVEDEVEVNIKEVDDGIATVDIIIGGKTYEAQTTRMYPDWELEDLEYEISRSFGGYYLGEAGIYYRTELSICHRDYPFSLKNGRLPIDIFVEYDGGLNAFAAVEGEYRVGG